MNQKFERFFNSVYTLFQIYLFQLVLFTAFRITFIIRLIKSDDFFNLPTETFNAIIRGSQFDTMIISYGLIIPFSVCLLKLVTSSKQVRKISRIFISWYCGISLALFVLVLFIDQYYYNYFQSHINVLIFGLMDDDTKAVMTSVWSDYPIIKILSAWFALLAIYVIYIKRLNKKRPFTVNIPIWLSTACSFAILLLFVLGIRESVGVFPLQSHDNLICKNRAINFLTINGVYALKTSFTEREKGDNLPSSILSNIHSLGYDNPAQAARDYFPKESLPNFLSDSAALQMLFHVTPKSPFLEKNKPNVVFIFMESMSNYNMNFDSKQMNLLGKLRKHFASDLLFRNFVSSGNATIQSLEYLLINTPVSLTQSKYRFSSFQSAVAFPFKKAGFENTFITGGESSWRNLNEFVPRQGFQFMAGKEEILSTVKNSEANHWGVYDEYLFDYAYQKLAAKSAKPKFMFIQTTSNHTPFELPDTYKPDQITLTKHVKENLQVTEDLASKNLNCYQYSNNCLGTFLDKIKNSPLAKNTIVVMTGDHNNLMLFSFDEAQQLQERGVPLYMYIPEKYKPVHPIDTTAFGSHKDIFPTLFNIALSNSRYYSIGNNLFDSSKESRRNFYGLNIGSSTAFNKNASVNFAKEGVLYKMNDKKELSLDESNLFAKNLLKQSRANNALSMYYILNEMKQASSNNKVSKPALFVQ